VYIYCLSHSLHSLHHLFVVSPILARNEARRALPPRNNWTRNDHRDPSREREGEGRYQIAVMCPRGLISYMILIFSYRFKILIVQF